MQDFIISRISKGFHIRITQGYNPSKGFYKDFYKGYSRGYYQGFLGPLFIGKN